MANRNWQSSGKIFSMHVAPTLIDLRIQIGTSGAVSSFSGQTVKSVTRLGTGLYEVQLQDNYFSLLQVQGTMRSPAIASPVTAGSFVTGTAYKIVTLGTTDYKAVGLKKGLTPAVGETFVATGAGAGTGTVSAVTSSGISSIEQINQDSNMLNSNPISTQGGAVIQIQTLAPTSSSVTTQIPANPANGSAIQLVIYLNSSSIS